MPLTLTRLAFAAALLFATEARGALIPQTIDELGPNMIYSLGTRAFVLNALQTSVQPAYPDYLFGIIPFAVIAPGGFYTSTDDALLAIFPDFPVPHFPGLIWTSYGQQEARLIERVSGPAAPSAPSSVPEPATFALCTVSLGALALFRYRRRLS